MEDFLDFAKFKEVNGDRFNLSPRFHFCGVDVTSGRGQQRSGCIMMLETEREKSIALGTRFPYEHLNQGDVILHETWRSQSGYSAGDQIEL